MITSQIIIYAPGDDVSRADRSRKIIDTFRNGSPLLVHSKVTVLKEETSKISLGFLKADFFKFTNLARVATSKALYISATGAFHRDIFDRFGLLPECDCLKS